MPRKAPALRVLEAIHNAQWAMTEEALQTILEIAARENLTPEAVAKQLGRPLDNTREVTIRDGIATIPTVGPMFRYADFFTEISGAVTYADLALDFTTALKDPSVRGIILAMDSPGGEANGVSQLSEMIRAGRPVKPIVAHIGGMGASAGYWLASAATEVAIADIGVAGSIGVRMTLTDQSGKDAKNGIKRYEFVSSQSPFKSSNPEDDAGRARIQALVDAMAQVFVESVAENRGTTAQTVLSEFGQGGLFVGRDAVAAGLADRVASYEATHADLVERLSGRSTVAFPAPRKAGATSQLTPAKADMADKSETTPAAAAPDPANKPAEATPAATATPEAGTISSEARIEVVKAETRRVLAIQALGKPGQEKLVAACIGDPECTVADAALRLLEHANAQEKANAAARLAAIEGDETNGKNPKTAAAPEGDQPQAVEQGRSATKAYYETTRRPQR